MRLLAFAFICLATAGAACGEEHKKYVPQPLTLLAYLESEVDDSSVQPVIDTITKADDAKTRVIIEINTGGGDVDAGFRLVKAIERAKRPVTCVVDGQADSMGSYIFESCARRIMTKRSILMIHEAGSEAANGIHSGDYYDKAAELAALSLAMFEHYAHHIPGFTVIEIANRTHNGRCVWLGWREAKKLGAVDAVVDSVADVK